MQFDTTKQRDLNAVDLVYISLRRAHSRLVSSPEIREKDTLV